MNRVLLPLSVVSLVALGASGLHAAPGSKPTKTIVETASSAGSFNTLVAALKAADLADALAAPGPFTVFAPNDEAFAKLPAGTVESLLKPENKAKLQSILKFHVTSGKVLSDSARNLTSAPTLQGSSLPIKSADGVLSVGTAKVVKADIEASNGVIHVIDTVVLPPNS